MGRSIRIVGLATLWVFVVGCNGANEDVSAKSITDADPADTDTGDLQAAELFTGEARVVKVIGTDSGCCEQTGQADECWQQDAINDGVTCTTNADCATGQTCDMTLGTALFKGRCTCATDADCNAGVCHAATGRCGPSACNGYLICSCAGGCIWWNDNMANTPAADAATLSRTCCEGNYPAGIIGDVYYSVDPGCDNVVTIGCSVDADCDDGNPCTQNSCDTASHVCQDLVLSGLECDNDGLGCTIDRCDTDATCKYAAERCPADSYDVDSKPNTCTIDCVEDPADTDSNGEVWTCYVDQTVPLDTDVKDITGACDYWTCDTGASPHVPLHVTQAVSDAGCVGFDDECNSYACDPLGAKGNCAAVTMNLNGACTSSTPADLCIAGECLDVDSDGVATCEDYPVPPPVPDNDPCNELACTPSSGAWEFVPDAVAIANSDSCDDGDPCTVTDVCQAGGVCAGAPMVCADTPCADYECSAGSCVVNQFYDATVSCNDGDGQWCTYGLCNGAGGCGANAVACGGTPTECNMNACLEPIDACGELADPAQIGNPCIGATAAPNCNTNCVEVPHSNSIMAGSPNFAKLGACQVTDAMNDTCDNAWNLGAFSLSDVSGTHFGAFGSTECATNQYHSIGANCLEAGFDMGFSSPDAVYSFSYEASGTGKMRNRYVVKVEPDNGYDATVYVSTSCNATSSSVASQACVPKGGSTQEDYCQSPYDCTPVDGTYTGYLSEAIVYEDTAANPGDIITVYIYVDGTQDISTGMRSGDFYVSVTKDSSCPDPATWYGGTIHTVMESGVNDLAVPVNGADFPGVVPQPTTQTGSRGDAQAVLLSGDTRLTSNDYTGEASDTDPYAWAGNDELWQLDILADAVSFSASMCDYGGWTDRSYDTETDTYVDTDSNTKTRVNQLNKPFNPMVGIFNCFGERLDFNDDNSSCGNETPMINPASPVVINDGPYYVLVDGYVNPGVTGITQGNQYDLSIFYDPPPELVPCNATTAASPLSIALPDGISQTNWGAMNYYPSGCVAVDFTGGNCTLADFVTHANNTDLNVRTNGIQPGAQNCDWDGSTTDPGWNTVLTDSLGNRFKCFPININYDIKYFDTVTGDTWVVSGYITQYDRHGNTLSGKIPIEPRSSLLPPDAMASWSAGTLDISGINLGFTHVDALTPEQIAICEANCTKTDIFYIDWQPTQGTCR